MSEILDATGRPLKRGDLVEIVHTGVIRAEVLEVHSPWLLRPGEKLSNPYIVSAALLLTQGFASKTRLEGVYIVEAVGGPSRRQFTEFAKGVRNGQVAH